MTLGELMRLSQRISITAKEEASRYDLPEIDVDHLLLALLVGGGPGAVLLRGQGLDLATARRATEQVRAERAASLGVGAPVARSIQHPAVGRTRWTPRALEAMKRSGVSGERALLTILLDEPSGLVGEVLHAADVDLEDLRRALAQTVGAAPGPGARLPAGPDWRAVEHTAFVPAPAAEVWALVSDPTRRPEWDSSVATVELLEPGLWLATSASNRPDGTRVRVPVGPRADAAPAHRIRARGDRRVGDHLPRPAGPTTEPATPADPARAGRGRHDPGAHAELGPPPGLAPAPAAAQGARLAGPGHPDLGSPRPGHLPPVALITTVRAARARPLR